MSMIDPSFNGSMNSLPMCDHGKIVMRRAAPAAVIVASGRQYN